MRRRLMIVYLLGVFFSPLAFAENLVPIQAEFAKKIVYSTNAAFDQDALKKDCAARGGRFNECGSVCDDQIKGMACIAVCAFTCEFDKNASRPIRNQDWQVVDARQLFTFRLPSDMKEIRIEGEDSYRGEFESPSMIVTFEYGLNSDSLNLFRPGYRSRRFVVDGKEGGIVTVHRSENSEEYPYWIAVHFPDVGTGSIKLTITARCRSEAGYVVAEEIFRSIRFKKKGDL